MAKDKREPELFEKIIGLHGCPSYALVKVDISEKDKSIVVSLVGASSNLVGLQMVMDVKHKEEKNPLVG